LESWGLKVRSRKAMGSTPIRVRTEIAWSTEVFKSHVARHDEVSHCPKAGIGLPGGPVT